ncbi:hypothetical protein PCASD_08092 [Puccinia coronata f. sp. avenae]|uniref:DNA replication regulator SLD2 n=1 Tax=Puccinia coronata f. sp. avenae TaxID=200324 RepID=A0A2N5UZG4_9BASI|nr:hypothetical protein PCASD_08092 [Puccinia coronata f. sp. avenae]
MRPMFRRLVIQHIDASNLKSQMAHFTPDHKAHQRSGSGRGAKTAYSRRILLGGWVARENLGSLEVNNLEGERHTERGPRSMGSTNNIFGASHIPIAHHLHTSHALEGCKELLHSHHQPLQIRFSDRRPPSKISMASTPTSNSQLSQLKTKLKTWERQFKAMEGRPPSKADIKANPEIAKMYSAYNSSRKEAAGSEDLPNPSSSRSHKHHQVLITPKRTGSSKNGTKTTSQENMNISPSKTYAHVNSPSKIRKLVEEHSPRKSHYDRLRKSQRKSTDNLKNTPSRLHQNPFDFGSGGGKGSPALFADLLLESKRDTPRTKARKYFDGIGSPLKPRSNSPEHSTSGTQRVNSGLSSFLRSRSNLSLGKPSHENPSDNLHDEDDEVLGPSPFKPASTNIFQPLFDEPEVEADHHSLSPSKMIKSKWKITSATPFISQSQSQNEASDGGSSSHPAPQCAQKGPDQTAKRKGFGFGIKRKRLVFPGEEDPSFYEDLPDPTDNKSSNNRSSITILSKKTRLERSDKQIPSKNLTKETGNGNTKQAKAQLLVKKSNTIHDSTKALLSDESEESADEKTTLANLPFGNPDQAAVVTELETFTFTTPGVTGAGATGGKTSTENVSKAAKDVKKGTGSANEPGPKPIKLGTRKVLVRAYRPIEPSQMNKRTDPDYLVDFGSSGLDGLDQTEERPEEEDAEVEEEAEEEAAEESEEVDDNLSFDDEDEDLEGDLGISEELMHVLNVEDRLTHEAEERRQLLRQRRRERKVRKIMDGMTLMEKTLTNAGSTGMSGPVGSSVAGGNSKSLGGGGGKKASTSKKQAGSSKQHPARSPVKQDSREDDLRFELALDELELDQQIDDQVVDEDDDWEDEPAGWKDELLDHDIDRDDSDSLDHQFVL